MSDQTIRARTWLLPRPASLRPVLAAAVVTALVAMWFTARWGGATVVRYGVDIGCGVAALVAGYAAWRAARREPLSYRRSWLLLAAGAFAWAAGEVAWTLADAISGSPAMNAAAADVGYLLFPLLACAAVLQLPGHGDGVWAPSRWLLDGAIVALSACYVLWDIVVEHISDLETSGFTLFTNASFPVVDTALLTAVVLSGTYASTARLQLGAVAAALGLLAVADTAYAYAVATGRYEPGGLCDITYVAAFATLAAAAYMPASARYGPRRDCPLWPQLRLALPYLPLAAAASVAMYRLAAGRPFEGAILVLWISITGLIIVRQYLALVDNRRLVHDLRREQDKLRTSALIDPLTGIGNRTLLLDRLQHALDLLARESRTVAVCWMDLDEFKLINDSLGHRAGDRVLETLAERMRGVLGASDTIARVGGDEFAVLLEDVDDPVAIAEKLHACAEPDVEVDGQHARARLSIGVATVTERDPPVEASELMRRADIAMHSAKNTQGEHVVRYRPGMAVPGAEDAVLREPLKRAIAAGSIRLHYQPIVNAATGELCGLEALARWDLHGQAIPPARFVPMAERLGLARELGQHVLDTALAQLSAWSHARGDKSLVVGVNLSPDQLLDPDLAISVATLLRAYDVHPRQLFLELTEGALLTESPGALLTARALSAMGVSLALDDFGTGYSSIAHLRGFPLASLKIDRSFLADIDRDEKAREFLQALYRLGRDVGLDVVAEGVERTGQLSVLRDLGPVLIQGYLFCAPQSAPYFEQLLGQPVPVLSPAPVGDDASAPSRPEGRDFPPLPPETARCPCGKIG